jgi:uncharacterized tellurite resistance protein B-like protein
MSTDWSKEDLTVYTLIYCANADVSESNVEMDYIKSKFKNSNFEELHTAYKNNSDYQSIQIITESYKNLGYDSPVELLNEMLELFKSDGNYSVLEKAFYNGIQRILKK